MNSANILPHVRICKENASFHKYSALSPHVPIQLNCIPDFCRERNWEQIMFFDFLQAKI